MNDQAPPSEPRHELAHLGHHGMYTPDLANSLWYFVDLLGMDIVARDDRTVYLRAYGDYEQWSLRLTEREQPGLEYVSWRMWSPQALERRVSWLVKHGFDGSWVEQQHGKGPAYQFDDPDGHAFRLYYQTENYEAPEGKKPVIPVTAQAYAGRGANVHHVDHVNLLSQNVRECREFWEEGFGLRTYEIIRRPDGSEAGAWMSSSLQGHELIYTQDNTAGTGRLHHFAYMVPTREEVLRASDIFADARIYIEAGPSKHTAIQGFYCYTREPGGNRIEVANGGYFVFAPDAEPYVWNLEEWAQKPGWGAPIPPEFHLYGTPVVDPEKVLVR